MCPIIRWEKIKQNIKEVATKYSRQKASENKLIISNLSEKVNELESNLPLSKECEKLLANLVFSFRLTDRMDTQMSIYYTPDPI